VKFHNCRIDNKYIHKPYLRIAPVHRTKFFIFNSTQGVKPMSSPWMKHGKILGKNYNHPKVSQNRFYSVLLCQKLFLWDSWNIYMVPPHRNHKRPHFRTSYSLKWKMWNIWATLDDHHALRTSTKKQKFPFCCKVTRQCVIVIIHNKYLKDIW
jgi:hypothetical protein